MAKSFSDHEKEMIRKKLIESCGQCWSKHGYQKTSVMELCRMASISAGTFYQLYPSKELLFIETAQSIQEVFRRIFNETLKADPTKNGFAKSLKLFAGELKQHEWILSLNKDLDLLYRKLPEDFIANDFKTDLADITAIIKNAGLKPKVDFELITSVFQMLMMSIFYTDKMTENADRALDFMIETAAENLFE